MRKDGGPAFPRTLLYEEWDDANEESQLSAMSYSFMEGMSLRDHVAVEVAKQFMATAVLPNLHTKGEQEVELCEKVCKAVYNFAEIFCKERASRREEDVKNDNRKL